MLLAVRNLQALVAHFFTISDLLLSLCLPAELQLLLLLSTYSYSVLMQIISNYSHTKSFSSVV